MIRQLLHQLNSTKDAPATTISTNSTEDVPVMCNFMLTNISFLGYSVTRWLKSGKKWMFDNLTTGMFRGINTLSIDSKGRMMIPSRYRSVIQESAENKLVATIDTEDLCLLLYPLPAWRQIEQKIESLPSFDRRTRRIQRLLIGHATELEMDSNGRILLPSLLRNYAKLEKRIMLIGQGKKFEIWDEASWNKNREQWLSEALSEDGDVPSQLQDISL